jgi:hypothetical protein
MILLLSRRFRHLTDHGTVYLPAATQLICVGVDVNHALPQGSQDVLWPQTPRVAWRLLSRAKR